ncbi:MAG: protein-methionine-sulfoxide reductase catalytic subunit MsrP [Gammaproteobacteria bacterium]|nr:protein-methionine-sulfoxide reductase catalytic subunit MsrP [Gammaproteobacteria bacterium]
MLIKTPDSILPSEITDRQVYLNRRKFMRDSAGLGVGAALLNSMPLGRALAATKLATVRNDAYSTAEEWTDYEAVTSYNNFYEFGTHKSDPARHSGKFKPQPWSVVIDGECMKPGAYAYEDIIRPHQLEERIYRLRCVEAWSMVIPWVGIPLADVLQRFEPTSQAKYVSFTTVLRPEEMPGVRRPVLDWPYREGLRIDEAMHPLTLLTVGLYGEALPNQNGAPIRLIVPWKYGFKSIKSIVRIEFTREQPDTAWNLSAPQEYGFYSNVNPEVDHPRWSQRKERRIGEFRKRETLMFNGYGEQVASLYRDMDLRKHY